MNTNTYQQPSPSATTSLTSQYYRSITDLPLRTFIDVYVNGNLAALIIAGFPSPLELQAAWEEIKEQYADAMGDQDQKLYVNLFKQVYKLQLSIEQVEMMVKAMEVAWCQPFAAELNALLNVNFAFNPSNPEQYNEQLKRCITLSKRMQITIDLKLGQLEAMAKKVQTNGGVVMGKEYFYSILITLSDHVEYPIQDSICVYEFCERIRRLNEYIAKHSKKS